MTPVERLATLTQRSYEAEEAWRRKAAADAAWERARTQLIEAIESVRDLISRTAPDD